MEHNTPQKSSLKSKLMNYLPFAIFYGIIPIMILGGLGMLFEKIAEAKADRRISMKGQTTLDIPFNILISLPGVVIYILFFRNLYEVSDDWRRFHAEEPPLHFNVTFAPPIEWLGLGIAILAYIAAVLILGAQLWSKIWPSRKAVLDGELQAEFTRRKNERELYGPGGAASNLIGAPRPRRNPRESNQGRPPSFPI